MYICIEDIWYFYNWKLDVHALVIAPCEKEARTKALIYCHKYCGDYDMTLDSELEIWQMINDDDYDKTLNACGR